MKKLVFYLGLSLGLQHGVLLAQNVGIGTATPDASAKLDIVDANRGILIPRVALTATNAAAPVTSPALSLLVYNTATAGTAPNNVWPGYYYWNGTQWVRIDTGNGDWKLDGNNNNSLRSIGTNDNYDFPIETNGTERMRVTTAGNVGIGTTTPNAKLSLSTDLANVKLAIFDGANDQYGFGVQSGLFRFNIGNAGARYGFFNDEAAAGTEVMTIQGNGNVGIGTTTPAVRLAVNGAGTNVYATDAWIDNNLHVQGNENLNQGGRGRLRVGTAWNYVGLYSDASSSGAGNDLVLGASSGYVRVGPSSGSGQNLRWSNSLLLDDQGGSIELGGNNSLGLGGTGTPYIDWHINDGYTRDFDIRMLGTADANGPVLRMFSHTGATQYFYFDLDWIGAYDCWADVSAWRYFANATNWLYDDVHNDLELIDNIRPKRVQDPKSGEYVLVNNPLTSPDFLVKPTHNNPNSYAVDITRVGSFSLGAIRMLRRETQTEYQALNAKIERLEKMIEQLTGQKLGELQFTSSLTLYKDMDKMVVMDVRITPQSKITIKGISGYQIIDQKEGSFTIKLDAPLAQDTPITYESSYE